MLNMMKKYLKPLLIILLGLAGGMLWQSLFLPYMVRHSAFEELSFVKDFKQRNIILFPQEKIIIQENKALNQAVEKVEKTVVAVRAKTKSGTIHGSGMILTNDGLVITLAELVPRDSDISFWVDNKQVAFEILKRDYYENLALIKLDQTGLSAMGFANLENIRKGQAVFLVGNVFSEDNPQKTVNSGIIKHFNGDFIKTNILEEQALNGSVLFDIEGNILGINTIGIDGEVLAIPISQVQTFSSF